MTTTTVLEVRYAETDMMGIMHHSRYYPWFEVARTEFIKQVGMTYSDMEKMGVLLPLTETEAKYISGLKYEEKAEISCTLFELSAARCGFKYSVKRLSDGKITTTGITRHGFVDAEFKALNLKKKCPEIYSKFESLLEN
ncbi:MAG: acyl-CoA thioesterase [Eubacteriales bacterium]|nr:acyl-CoA thioesterase [Eubacteriales bacterium]